MYNQIKLLKEMNMKSWIKEMEGIYCLPFQYLSIILEL